jgi:hypothetical protein
MIATQTMSAAWISSLAQGMRGRSRPSVRRLTSVRTPADGSVSVPPAPGCSEVRAGRLSTAGPFGALNT